MGWVAGGSLVARLVGWVSWWLHGGCVVLVVADWIGCLCVYLA